VNKTWAGEADWRGSGFPPRLDESDSRHPLDCARSSAARAPARHAGDRRSDSCRAHCMSCSSSGLGHCPLKAATGVRFPHTTLFETPSSNGLGCDATNVAMVWVQIPPESPLRRSASKRAIATPLVGKPRDASSDVRPGRRGDYRSRSGIGLDSKSELAAFNSLATCYVVLASRTANAGRRPKCSWVRVPETTPLATTSGSGRPFHKRFGVRFKSARRDDSSGCSEVVSRAVRDRETVGSTPTAPTSCPCSSVAEQSSYKRRADGSNPSAGTKRNWRAISGWSRGYLLHRYRRVRAPVRLKHGIRA
jgi:hypothetical protein